MIISLINFAISGARHQKLTHSDRQQRHAHTLHLRLRRGRAGLLQKGADRLRERGGRRGGGGGGGGGALSDRGQRLLAEVGSDEAEQR